MNKYDMRMLTRKPLTIFSRSLSALLKNQLLIFRNANRFTLRFLLLMMKTLVFLKWLPTMSNKLSIITKILGIRKTNLFKNLKIPKIKRALIKNLTSIIQTLTITRIQKFIVQLKKIKMKIYKIL